MTQPRRPVRDGPRRGRPRRARRRAPVPPLRPAGRGPDRALRRGGRSTHFVEGVQGNAGARPGARSTSCTRRPRSAELLEFGLAVYITSRLRFLEGSTGARPHAARGRARTGREPRSSPASVDRVCPRSSRRACRTAARSGPSAVTAKRAEQAPRRCRRDPIRRRARGRDHGRVDRARTSRARGVDGDGVRAGAGALRRRQPVERGEDPPRLPVRRRPGPAHRPGGARRRARLPGPGRAAHRGGPRAPSISRVRRPLPRPPRLGGAGRRRSAAYFDDVAALVRVVARRRPLPRRRVAAAGRSGSPRRSWRRWPTRRSSSPGSGCPSGRSTRSRSRDAFVAALDAEPRDRAAPRHTGSTGGRARRRRRRAVVRARRRERARALRRGGERAVGGAAGGRRDGRPPARHRAAAPLPGVGVRPHDAVASTRRARCSASGPSVT